MLELDLRGIRCPLNWAKAKVRLEATAEREIVVVIVDDPRSVRDLPRAAEAEGYAVLDVREDGASWRISIQK